MRVHRQSRMSGRYNMHNYKTENGFSIVDLLIAIAIVGIISTASIPSLKGWSRNYNMQSAAMNLYAHMQMAKLGSVKVNKAWSINFNPGGLLGYQVIHKVNNVDTIVKTVDFRTQYNGEIQYGDPTATQTYPTIDIQRKFRAASMLLCPLSRASHST